jgi:hypothetical protein
MAELKTVSATPATTPQATALNGQEDEKERVVAKAALSIAELGTSGLKYLAPYTDEGTQLLFWMLQTMITMVQRMKNQAHPLAYPCGLFP